jgi:hypothetical protein
MTPADTLEYLDSFPQESEEKTDIGTQAALVEPDRKVLTDSLGFAESEEFKQASASLSIDIAVVDGSKKSFPLNDFTRAMKQFYSTDRLTPVNSSYRINNSAIIWQRNEQALARVAIANRVEKISSLYSQYFKLKPLSFSLDFTIVIGADFKMPQLTDNYSRSAKDENDYYVEILNGYKTAGVARQLANRLQNQRFKGHKIIVVNYRNADKLNYLQSFIKCEGSKTELAKEFAAHFKLPKSISNAPLYDIKILIGADIQL